MARNQGQNADNAAHALNHIAFRKIGGQIIASLHVNRRPEPREKSVRIWLSEENDEVDRLETRHLVAPGLLIIKRSGRPFEISHAFIGINANDKRIAQLTRLRQVADVSPMQEIEATVRRYNTLALRAQSDRKIENLLKRNNLILEAPHGGPYTTLR